MGRESRYGKMESKYFITTDGITVLSKSAEINLLLLPYFKEEVKIVIKMCENNFK
jgi:hypothetical protein